MLKYFNRDLESHSNNNLHNADNQKELDPANEIPPYKDLLIYLLTKEEINQ